MTYNGDNFDFPYIAKRCEVLGLDLKKETGFGATSDAQSTHFLSTCCTHIDAIHWVKRDSYLPAGSHGLKAVCRAKLGYDPLEIGAVPRPRTRRPPRPAMSARPVRARQTPRT